MGRLANPGAERVPSGIDTHQQSVLPITTLPSLKRTRSADPFETDYLTIAFNTKPENVFE
jgi:hypothetical protein